MYVLNTHLKDIPVAVLLVILQNSFTIDDNDSFAIESQKRMSDSDSISFSKCNGNSFVLHF